MLSSDLLAPQIAGDWEPSNLSSPGAHQGDF